MRWTARLALPLLLLAPLAGAEDPPAAADVTRAVEAGGKWLALQGDAGEPYDRPNATPELVLLTLVHSRVSPQEKAYRDRLAALEKTVPRFTYRTALLAMALAEINPGLYRAKLAHCAQWLVDMQLAEGEWGYPGPPNGPAWKPEGLAVSPPEAPKPETEGGMAPERWTIVRRVSATGATSEKGDFSNTQFAILGLRACRDSGIDVPKETWQNALKYLRAHQHEDGGFGYDQYDGRDDGSYASLTAAGACSYAICLNALGTKDVKSDVGLKKAIGWLDKRFDPEQNAGKDVSSVRGPSPWQYYHLYSVERAGRVIGLEKLNKRSWYAAGANVLLKAQKSDGHWEDVADSRDPHIAALRVADTCFALLFLARATRPITR